MNEKQKGYYSKLECLGLDGVFALEHLIDLGQVVSARSDGLNLTLGGKVLLEVSLFSEVAHLQIVSVVLVPQA